MANTTVDLDYALAVAIDLAIQAGEQLLTRARERITPFGAQLTIVQKLNAVDLVTEADEDAEKIIRNGLKKHFPTMLLWGRSRMDKACRTMNTLLVMSLPG
jgi:fructose-1,6-bisphosphatase/inositol monophosphatase family enzyme